MSCKANEWNENQVISAFGRFINPDSDKSTEEIYAELSDLLKSRNKSLFNVDDIFLITEQLVPSHCSNKLADAIIGVLEKN